MAKLVIGVNDLATLKPKIAELWHPTKNGNLKPCNFAVNSNESVWWYLPYDDPDTGKHFNFEWEAKIKNCVKSNGCPYLAKYNPPIWIGFNDLQSNYPELAKEWHPIKNGSLKPTDVTCCSGKSVWWYLPYDDPETGKHFNFEWEMIINKRTKKNSRE